MSGREADDDEFVRVMREARDRFIAGFADQLDHMRSLAAEADRDGQLAALHTVAHRLAGLSGTVGFRTVGEEAAALETIAEEAARGRPLDRDRAFAAIQRLADAFAADVRTQPSWAVSVPKAAPAGPVLIVEDDAEQRRVVQHFLERSGFTTIGLSSGSDVLDEALRHRPSAVLLDVHLPGMDGFSVCRQLKANPHTRSMPVVFVTTRAAMNERLAGLTLGADDYLTKPVDLGELHLRLKRLTGRAVPAPAATADRAMDYTAWIGHAQQALQAGSAAVALIRVPADRQNALQAALADNLRRRDLIGCYDRTHLVVLLPETSAARAVTSLREILDRAGGADLAAGIAGGAGVSPDTLIAQADEALVAARHRGERAVAHADAAAPSRSVHRVLLADDDPDVMRIVDAQMRAMGFQTAMAFDGHGALEGLASRPDVVVLDLMMPKMTGFEVLQQIARLDKPRPKVIVLSGRGREDDVTRAFELGADDYMVKPFSPQELGARIGRLVR